MKINVIEKIRNRITISGTIKFLALLFLAGAYVFGVINNSQLHHLNLMKIYSQGNIVKISSHPLIYKYGETKKNLLGYVVVQREQGWGGPLYVAIEVDLKRKIKNVHVLQHKETSSFYTKLVSNKFFDQFVGKKITSSLALGEDIDSVSRATISSMGFTKAIRSGSYIVAKKIHKLKIKEKKVLWKFGSNEVILIVLFLFILIGFIGKFTKIRYFSMAAGLIFLGFYLSMPLSISHVTSVFFGYFPVPQEYLLWWILILGIFLMIVFIGRNLYCSWLCPFGALQEFLGRISNINLKLHPHIIKYGKFLRSFLTWFSLMIIFISRNPALGNYEPFAAIFSFQGSGIIWYVLPVILFSSFFIRRSWCRFFCPAGMALDSACKTRNSLMKFNFDLLKKSNT